MKSVIFFLTICFSLNAQADYEIQKVQTEIYNNPKETGEVKEEFKTTGTTDRIQKVQKQQTIKIKEFQKHLFTANLGTTFSLIEKTGTKPGLMLGGKYSFYFSPEMGVFIGLDYMERSFSNNFSTHISAHKALNLKMTSIDIPFGVTFRYGNPLSASGASFLGLYYSLPQNGKSELRETFRYRGEKSYSGDLEGKSYLGLLLHSETYFKINKTFALGFFFSLKFGFENAITKAYINGNRRMGKSIYVKRSRRTRNRRPYSTPGHFINFDENEKTMDIMFGIATAYL